MRIALSQNGYYFGGYFQDNFYLDIDTISSYSPSAFDAFIYKTDLNGNGQWIRKIRGQNKENFKSISIDEYDNIYVLGNYNSPTIYVDSTETITKTIIGNSGGYDTFIAKYNRSGTLQWFIRKGSTYKDIYNDFVVRNNVIYATGYFGTPIIFNDDTLRTNRSNMYDPFLAAFNEIGDPIAAVSMQGTDSDTLTDIVNAGTIVNMDSDSRAYVSGYYRARQFQIGDSTYTSDNFNKSDLFFAIYEHPPKAVITDEQMVSCNGMSDGMLQVTPYFMNPPYTYKWSHNPGLNQAVATNLPAGSYTVTVTDGNLDSAKITGVVTQPDPVNIAEVITKPSCNNGSDGAIDITVTGGTPDYSFAWTTSGGSGIEPTQEDQTGLSKGLYYLALTDDNGCAAYDTFDVGQPMPISFGGSTVTDVTIPPGGNGAIEPAVSGGTAPYNFAWIGPDSYTSTEDTITDLDGGNYTLLITDANLCNGDTVFLVYEEGLFMAEVSQKTDVSCYGLNDGTATISVINGQAPFQYKWSDEDAFVSSDTFTIRTGMGPGTYYITITDNDSKTANASVKITTPSSALSLVLQPTDLRCYNDNSGVIDLTVSGGTLPYAFDWNNGFTGEDLVNVGAGNYSVTVTDARGCSANDGASLSQPASFVTNIAIDNPVRCHGDRTAIVTANSTGGTGAYSFVWNDPGNQTTQSAYELSAGDYKVIVTDENLCTSEATITITQPVVISISEAHTNVSCFDGSNGQIVPTISGGTAPFEYFWSGGQTTRIISDLQAGTYDLVVTDYYNCVDSSLSVEITEPASAITIISQESDSNSITVVAEGGTPPLSYTITGGTPQATGEFTGLANGIYIVEVTDANGCGPVESQPFIINISGIEGIGLNGFKLFPNPSEGQFNLVFESGEHNFKIEILNITGSVVYNREIETISGNVNTILDLSDFPKGIYLMKINNVVVKERLIVN
ncbi:MAG: T9SS type A sorting domain-containing protein [Bacteroidales bacterium]|nr:T9SS type A sorting domain-containing protein [Bacteroidales bacterium]